MPVSKWRTPDGGLNTEIADTDLPGRYASDCQNVQPGKRFGFEKIQGYSKFNSGGAISGTPTIVSLMQMTDGTNFIDMCSATTKLYKFNTGTSVYDAITLPSDESALEDGLKFRGESINGRFIFGNGSDKTFSYNGGAVATKLFTAGLAAPSIGSFSAADKGSGTGVVGTVRYKIRSYTTEGEIESNSHDSDGTSLTMTTDDNAVTLSNIAAQAGSFPRVTHQKIYRTANGGSVFYFVATITDATTTYEDTTPDATLILNAVMETEGNNGVPPVAKFFAATDDVLFYAGNPTNPRRLYRAVAGKPESVPASFNIDVGETEGDFTDITGLHVHNGRLYVFKEHTIYVVISDSSTFGYYTRALTVPYGTIAQNSIQSGKSGMFFHSTDGFHVTDGYRERNIGYLNTWRTFLNDLETGRYDEIEGAYDETRNLVEWYATLSGNSTNDRSYAFELNRHSWWPTTIAAASAIKRHVADKTPDILIGGYSDGFVYKRNQTNNFDGSAIDAWLKSGADTIPEGGGIEHLKLINDIEVVYQDDNSATITVDIYVDDAASASYTGTITMDQTNRRVRKKVHLRGRTFKVRFRNNTAAATFGVTRYAWHFEKLGVN